MTFLIHFEHKDGTQDSLFLTGHTIKEIQEQAQTELEKRDVNMDTVWSKEKP